MPQGKEAAHTKVPPRELPGKDIAGNSMQERRRCPLCEKGFRILQHLVLRLKQVQIVCDADLRRISCQNAKRCCAQQKKSRRNHRPVSADAAPFPLNGFLLLFSYAFHKIPTLPQHSAAIRIPESFRTIRNGRQYHDYFLIMCRLFRSISKFRRLLRSRFERIRPENRD